jgi:vitamin B12 transporter
MRTFTPARALAAGALLLIGAPAAAQQTLAGDTVPRYELEPVTVAVTRAPVRRDQETRRVDVVDGRDIERTPAREVADLLKKTGAVDVIQFPGLLSGVSIRGFRPQFSGINPRTLILVDGRPAGANNLATLDLAAVERIEVLRGPASALYGSSAMGGVVNVITRRSTAGGLGGSATLDYGSFQTRSGSVSMGGELGGGFDLDLSATSYAQGGYRTGSARTIGASEVVRVLGDGREQRLPELVRDTLLAFSEYGYRSGNVRMGYQLSPGWRADVSGTRFVADAVQNPGDVYASYDSRSLKDVERGSGELALSGTVGGHALLARAFGTRETVDYYNRPEGDVFVSFRTPTRWVGFQLQDAVSFGAHSLVAGVDGNRATAESQRFTGAGVRGAPFSPNSSIASGAAFAEGRFTLLGERLHATLGGRLDHITFDVRDTEFLTGHAANSERHTVFNPSAGVRYAVLDGLSLRASGGRAFVTPDAFNVAGYSELSAGARAVRITRGNPDLRPESSSSWDAALALVRPRGDMVAELTYFHTDVRDRITSVTTPGNGLTPTGDTIRTVTTYLNVDEAEIRGLEATLSYDLGTAAGLPYSLRLFGNGTRILRAQQVAAGTRTRILNVADVNLNAGLELDDRRRFATRLTARYVGERQDTDFSDWMNPGTITFPHFLVLDLAGDVRLGDRYRVGLRLENLSDENYYEVRGYPLPGRALRAQVSVLF